MRYIFTTLLLFILPTMARSQDSNWDAYLAPFEKGPGSVFLNMDLIHTAPKKNLPFLVITGVTYAACRADGLPENAEIHNLNEISAQVGRAVSSLTKTEIAGTFTCQCERLDYLYVHDTLHIRDKLKELYTVRYQPYRYHISIRQDQGWAGYLKFLYPKEEVFEAMANEKLLHPLRLAGDKLDKPRPVDHWLFFANSHHRDQFMKYAAREKFKVEGKDYLKDAELPYQLHISRTDPVDPASINPLTLELRRQAKALEGNYDGWETTVQKDK
jgi:uncharacterized protein (TIGR01619 family)